jgi:PQQ-dependent dehydrogenase (methanol/ethanol family)
MPSEDFSNTRFSGLQQINSTNVAQLKVLWTFGTGVNRGNESAPIVAGSTMYIVTPYPNYLYALDLNDYGSVKWRFDPQVDEAVLGEACCDSVNRGVVFFDNKVFMNTLDCHTIAIDANTGKEIWNRTLGNFHIGETMTGAPFVVNGKVFVGNAGSQFGARGWIQALDANTGKTIWKAFNTGPDSECLIGEIFRPFYETDRGKDLGVKSWPPNQWQIGGGTVWGWMSYDPQLDLLYYGTGDPAGWNADVRAGDNKWASGIFARKPTTGQAVWYYQYTPHDLYGHDGINESIIVELSLAPNEPKRKVLLHADRNGYLYVIDAQSGQVLSATAFVRITGTKEVDLKTGRLIFNEEKKPALGKVIRDIAPAAPGGKDWQPSAFSPRTGLMYLPHQTLSMDFQEAPINYIAGTPYMGADAKFYADPVSPGNGNLGAFTAWDPVAKKPIWNIEEKFPVWCGTFATAGGLVFYGTMDRWFKAVDDRTGKVLWKFKVDSGIVSQPITYLGPDGKQCVAVLSGVGGWPGSIVSHDLNPGKDASAGHGFGNAMKDLPKYTSKGGTLYIFSLP